jgi:hypothetical protein
MEATGSSETMESMFQTTASHSLGNYNFNAHSRENVNLNSEVLTPVTEQQGVNGH